MNKKTRAVAIVLVAVLVLSLVASMVLPYLAGGLAGGVLGGLTFRWVPVRALTVIFGLFLLYAGVRYLL